MFFPKFYSEERKLRQNKNCNKTAKNIKLKQKIPFYKHHCPYSFFITKCLTLFTPFLTINFSFSHKILQKTAQKHGKQRIFYKTPYLQSQDFTPALEFYTSSAPNAHDNFSVCCNRPVILRPKTRALQEMHLIWG